MSGFGCVACGSAAVVPPTELSDEAAVVCRGCGHPVCSWGALKDGVLAAIVAEQAELVASSWVSPDPLPELAV